MSDSEVPDCWDMENDPTNNPQFKRKQTSSLTSGIKSKKKITVIPIKLNSYNESLKIPTVSTTTDSNIALDVTTKATEYVCELAEGLADEYYTEDLIRPSLAKIAKALDQVVDTRHPRRLTFGTQDSEPYQIHQTHNQKLHSTKEQPSKEVGNDCQQKYPYAKCSGITESRPRRLSA